jgi:chromosome segregation ATPase
MSMNMSDIVSDLLSANPNEPASQGAVLLLRNEVRSDFKALRTEMDQRFAHVDRTMTSISVQVATLVEQQVIIRADLANLNKRVDSIEQRMDRMEAKMDIMSKQLDRLVKKLLDS